MADFCNQCARDFGFPEGDLKAADRVPPEPGMGYPELCEGCGPCLVNEKGDCVDPCCDKSHGCVLKAEEIMKEFTKRSSTPEYYDAITMPGGQHTAYMLLEDIAKELCGEHFTYELVQQIHDEYVVKISFKDPNKKVDLIDEAYSALSTLTDMFEGDEDVEPHLSDIEKALQYALDLKQCIKDMHRLDADFHVDTDSKSYKVYLDAIS